MRAEVDWEMGEERMNWKVALCKLRFHMSFFFIFFSFLILFQLLVCANFLKLTGKANHQFFTYTHQNKPQNFPVLL